MECSFPGCGNVMKYKRDKLCAGHRTQIQRGKPLTPLKAPKTQKYCRKGDRNPVHGMGLCKECFEQEYKHGLPIEVHEAQKKKGGKGTAKLTADRVPEIPYVAPTPEEFKAEVRRKTSRYADAELLNDILGVAS